MSKTNPGVSKQRSPNSSMQSLDRQVRTGITPLAMAAVEAWLASMPTQPQRWLEHVSHQTRQQSYRIPLNPYPHHLPQKP